MLKHQLQEGALKIMKRRRWFKDTLLVTSWPNVLCTEEVYPELYIICITILHAKNSKEMHLYLIIIVDLDMLSEICVFMYFQVVHHNLDIFLYFKIIFSRPRYLPTLS